MPYNTEVTRSFSHRVRVRGEQLYKEGRVTLGRTEPGRAFLKVSDGEEEVIDLDWRYISDGEVYVSCTCEYFDEVEPCPHIWAALLSVERSEFGSIVKRAVLIFAEDESDEEGWDDFDDFDDEDDDFENEALWKPLSAPKQSSRPAWQRQLSDIFHTGSSGPWVEPIRSAEKDREVYYVLDVAASQASSDLTIQFLHRETKLNGEFGKLKPLSLNQDEADVFPVETDRALLSALVSLADDEDDNRYSYSYRYRSPYGRKVCEASVPRTALEHVVPRLCATGRFRWVLNSQKQDVLEEGRPVAWDEGPAWRFQLRIDADDAAQEWHIEGQLVRDGEPPIPLKAPPLVLSIGLALHDDRLLRWEAADGERWLEALRRTPVVKVPYADRWQFLHALWQLPTLPDAALPENLACAVQRVAPRPRLMVHAPRAPQETRLYADVAFDYDDLRVRAGDVSGGIVDSATQRVLVRDHQQEAERIRELFSHGARRSDDSRYDVWMQRKSLDAVTLALLQAGWNVEAQGQQYRQAGQWRMSVVSGVDWFDLEGDCQFDGQSVGLPAILAALKQGEKFVQLGDGSRGILPQEWLDRFAPLAGLGTVEGEHVRFRPSQAMVLDALLAAQENVSVDEQFAHIRSQLQSFSGIRKREAPRGFSGELREYQKEGIGWLHFLREFRLGGCLADDMGLGKTIQVLALLQARRMRPKVDGWRAPSLAVVPRSLVFNWIEEAKRFAPGMRVLDYTGTQRQEALEQLDNYDLVVTTYGTLHRDIAALSQHRFDYAILDEAQAIKNAQAQRAKACRLIQADHRLALTGTPVENHLGELWSLFEFLNPGMLGSSGAFQTVSGKIGDSQEGLETLRRAMAPFILRRTKRQVLTELPEKTEQTLYCDLEGKQLQRYREIRDYYRASLSKRIAANGMAQSKIHVLEALLRLRQAACHLGLLDKDQVGQSSAKLDALMEQLREVIDEGHKALVFSQFTSFLSIVRKRLDAEKIVYEYLDGRTRLRQQRVDRFQNDDKCPLFLISLKAGGHGLNLTAADYVFILDPWWNPAVEAQAIDRVHRIGQERPVFAYRLIARDTVEEKIIELQQTKRDLADAIINADGNILRSLSADDLELLLS